MNVTNKCTLAATMAKIIGNLQIFTVLLLGFTQTFNDNKTFTKHINATLLQLT